MTAKYRAKRTTVDLSSHPDLVVIYLGMRAESLRGLATIVRIGPQIKKAVDAKPDGLLLHENLTFSVFPLHVGMRQYWRDLDSLERWSRDLPHRAWWTDFLRDPGGTSFWHETYCRNGTWEAIYLDAEKPVGLANFAPVVPARGPMFSARTRLRPGSPAPEAPVRESELS